LLSSFFIASPINVPYGGWRPTLPVGLERLHS
jgi:hypothetical protein